MEYDACDKEHKRAREEQRKEKEEEKRINNEKLLEQLIIFEEEVITIKMLQDIKFCWQVVFRCKGFLLKCFQLQLFGKIVQFVKTFKSLF